MDPISPVILTPAGKLVFLNSKLDWRESLFELAAKRELSSDPALRFWRSFADIFVGALCRLPDDLAPRSLTPPGEADLDRLLSQAPPMTGGEYLSAQALLGVWENLAAWTEASLSLMAGAPGDSLLPMERAGEQLQKFLPLKAPKWRRVGRVTFNLAENSSDPARPFAFLATYVTSLTVEGRDRHLPLGKAIKRYAQAGDNASLQSLLIPVKEAAAKLKWVQELVEKTHVYQPVAFTLKKAYRFLQDIPILEESGLSVRIPDWWNRRPQVRVEVVLGDWSQADFAMRRLVEWDVRLAVGDQSLTQEEIDELLKSGAEGLVLFKGQWLEVDSDKLREALEHWQEVKNSSEGSGFHFIKAMRLLAGLPAEPSAGGRSPFPEPSPWVAPRAGEALSKVLEALRKPEAAEQPPELRGTLRPYQKKGLGWLSLLSGLGLGACLADDMGLGKTVQVLALLLSDKKRRPGLGPSLLVAPASLLSNWKSEAERFAPTLKVAIWHPSETGKETLKSWEESPGEYLDPCDLVITSYALAHRQQKFFEARQWRMVILDEAQAIKNPGTAQSKAVRKFKASSKLALTGTPIENRLTDLWSLFDFLNPGLLSSISQFQSAVQLMSGPGGDAYAPLRRLVAPYILRRLKSDRSIIDDLPDKIETRLSCHLTEDQAKLYQEVVKVLQLALDEAKEKKPSKENDFLRRGLVLQALTRLRQIINHPAQLTGDGDWDPKRSGKFERLSELCREMAERQDRLLVFTQYREITEPLFSHLCQVFGREGLVFHGGTHVKDRRKIVESFQADYGPPFLILTLKAGGTGLNLTAAGQVIHFDRWWNPAVEDQATDRAYRIGQKRNVVIHKCVTRGTLEEKIDNLLTEKRLLAEGVLDQSRERELDLTGMDDEALMRVVSLDLDRAVLSAS
ncbi:MAG: DEAD/DEAH box helicase [Deltaproteobacteria bacterium]|jgi:non-specific serine/threonine protein kinase|nr:DEAD/DEAH box helicase [Deltaproteobacteria bacterium]